MKILILGISLLFIVSACFGQQRDSLLNPVLPQLDLKQKKAKTKDTKSKDWPNPNRAILFSIIPGGGQIYNKRLWKVPIVYAALGTGIFVINFNRKFYLEFKTALNLSRAGLPHKFSSTGVTSATLKIQRDRANRYMQQAYLATLAIYLLQSTEAFVDAHLRNFDMDEDLSFKLQPKMEYIPELNQPVVGLSLRFPISR